MPMSPRLLRPIASGVHPEAAAWRSAVVANGGSVSASTMKAVSTFCAAIDAAGIRDRFYRLNLFCGNSDASLIAPRVPLYRGPSRTGTQYGNALDTNNNFVQGDYAETVGLDGNQTTKYLDTGLTPDDLSEGRVAHLALYKGAGSVGASTLFLAGCYSPAGRNYYIRQNATTDALAGQWASGSLATGGSADTAAGLAVLSRPTSDATGAVLYKDASSIATGGGATAETNTNNILVFNVTQPGGTVSSSGWPHVIAAYSVGLGLSSAQVTAYDSAIAAFMQKVGRL